MDRKRFGELVPLYFGLQLTGVCVVLLSLAGNTLGWPFDVTYWLSAAVWVAGRAASGRSSRPLSVGHIASSVGAVFLAIVVSGLIQANSTPDAYWVWGALTLLSFLGAAYVAPTKNARHIAMGLGLGCAIVFAAGRVAWPLRVAFAYLAAASAFAFTLIMLDASLVVVASLIRRRRPSEQALQPDAPELAHDADE